MSFSILDAFMLWTYFHREILYKHWKQMPGNYKSSIRVLLRGESTVYSNMNSVACIIFFECLEKYEFTAFFIFKIIFQLLPKHIQQFLNGHIFFYGYNSCYYYFQTIDYSLLCNREIYCSLYLYIQIKF